MVNGADSECRDGVFKGLEDIIDRHAAGIAFASACDEQLDQLLWFVLKRHNVKNQLAENVLFVVIDAAVHPDDAVF